MEWLLLRDDATNKVAIADSCFDVIWALCILSGWAESIQEWRSIDGFFNQNPQLTHMQRVLLFFSHMYSFDDLGRVFLILPL